MRSALCGVLVLSVSCAEVHVPDRADVDSSSATGNVGPEGGDGAGGGVVSGSGGSGTPGDAGGSGGAPPEPPEVVACTSVRWRGAQTAAAMQGIRSTSAHLAFAPEPVDGSGHLLVLGASYEDDSPAAMAVAYLRTDERLDTAPREYRASTADVAPPVTFRDGVPIVLHADDDHGPRLIDLRGLADAPFAAAVPASLLDARALAWSGVAARFAVVHGADDEVALTLVDDAGRTTPLGILSCADRQAAAAVAPLGAGFVVAHAHDASGAACDRGSAGAPTVLQLTRVHGDGSAAATDVLSLDAPIVAVHLTPRRNGAGWLAVRTDGSGETVLAAVDGDGRLGATTAVPVAPGRGVAIASRGDGLVLLDVGAAIGGEPVARLRVLDAALAIVGETATPLLHALSPEGTPALHVSHDGGVMAAAWIGRRGDGHAPLVAATAACE